jgi:hypothetical protein
MRGSIHRSRKKQHLKALKRKGFVSTLKFVDDERVFHISDKDHHTSLAIHHTPAAFQMMVAAVHSNADTDIYGSKPLLMVARHGKR